MEDERAHILRLLQSGDIANIKIALQILSGGAVEWGRDIEKAITEFVLQPITFGIPPIANYEKDLFGLSIVFLPNPNKEQGGTIMQFTFSEKHTWKLFFRI